MSSVFDPTPCELGEGAFWHPEREQLFWFDILNRRLMTRVDGATREWRFPGMVSAAARTGRDGLLIASESCLWHLDLASGDRAVVVPLEGDNPRTRSNDGRADRQGGFWIGTMGKRAEPEAGAIYRYHRGEVRQLFSKLTIPNAICFSPDGSHAHFADTARGKVWRVALDAQGWPVGDPVLFLDPGAEGLNPDGAVIDSEGTFWNAQWGAGRVAAYDPRGQFLRAIRFGAPHTSCPAFGGPDLATLFCTTAREGLGPDDLAAHPLSGATFSAPAGVRGLPEPEVIL